MSPRNTLGHLATVSSLALLALCCGLFILFSVSGTGWQALSVPTGSMRPSMPPGSLALVHRVPISSLKIGDIITYANPRDPKTTISHRIIKKYMISQRIPGFITKGDANKSADVPIPAGSVEGRVVLHIPHLGAWLIGAKSWLVISVIVYLPALIIMGDELRRLTAYYRAVITYRLYGVQRIKVMNRPKLGARFATAATLGLVLISSAGIYAPTAFALISSNVVTLRQNKISAVVIPPPGTAACSNTTSISIITDSNQTATTGQASASGTTNGTSARSGSASNTSSAIINGSIINGC